MAPIAHQLAGADTPEAAWKVVSQNPQWLVDPETAPGVTGFLKTQTQVATAERTQWLVNSPSRTELILSNGWEALTRHRVGHTVDEQNKDGSFSPMQWQALGVAESFAQTPGGQREVSG